MYVEFKYPDGTDGVAGAREIGYGEVEITAVYGGVTRALVTRLELHLLTANIGSVLVLAAWLEDG